MDGATELEVVVEVEVLAALLAVVEAGVDDAERGSDNESADVGSDIDGSADVIFDIMLETAEAPAERTELTLVTAGMRGPRVTLYVVGTALLLTCNQGIV